MPYLCPINGRMPPSGNRLKYHEFEAMRFFRLPDWRFRYAGEIVYVYGRIAYVDDDPVIYGLVRLIRRYRQISRDPAPRDNRLSVLVDEFGPMTLALTIAKDKAYGQLRIEIEARVLAGQTAEQIGEAVALPNEVIEQYEQGFFQIRDRLDCPAYIFSMVIGEESLREQVVSEEQLVKRIAYSTGQELLEIALLVHRARTPETKRQVANEVDRRIQQTPELHRLLATDRPQPIGGEIQALLEDLKSFGDDEQQAA